MCAYFVAPPIFSNFKSNPFCQQVRTCIKEPDADPSPDNTPGSYMLQANLMKRVYELVDLVELKSVDELRQIRAVPADPLVMVAVNRLVGPLSEFLPNVKLGKIPDEEVRLFILSL